MLGLLTNVRIHRPQLFLLFHVFSVLLIRLQVNPEQIFFFFLSSRMMQTHLMQNQNLYSSINKRCLKNKELCSELEHHYHLKMELWLFHSVAYIVIYLVSLE